MRQSSTQASTQYRTGKHLTTENAAKTSQQIAAELFPIEANVEHGQSTGLISTDRGRTVDFHNRLPTVEELWDLLDSVPDPEVPAVSVVDLGIVRNIQYASYEAGQEKAAQETQGYWRISITPTYSGCPATELIENEIEGALLRAGVNDYKILQQLSPSWTTDWITDKGREQLRKFGIAPPAGDSRKPGISADIECPRCGSNHHKKVSEFGSTACKALYQCEDCHEPFDYFKCI